MVPSRRRSWSASVVAVSALWCMAGGTTGPKGAFLRPPSQLQAPGFSRELRPVAVVPLNKGVASLQAKPLDVRPRPLQQWARYTLDRIHSFALHLGLFCLVEEYARQGFLGGHPASAGQPVNGLELLPLQGLGGESLHM
eukprot:Skav230876  [mRNA]  locus=scaffold1995:69026:74554:- [translate_table: standard]